MVDEKTRNKFKQIQNDCIELVKYGWGLTPQPLLEEYKDVPIEEWEAKHFGYLKSTDEFGVDIWEFPTFKKNKHLTWQQVKALYFVNKSKQEGEKKKIAIAAGRGIGKTFIESVIIHWGLIQCRDSQGAATSYSRELMYDVLWKELAKTHRKCRKEFKELFEWSATRFSIKESPNTWFISAKTGKKENPEALAGMHGEFVLLLADEASGVPDEIFETALDGLTEESYLVFMASNWRRLVGFFNDQCKSKVDFEVLQFSSLESPLYDYKSAQEIARSEGIESDRYRIEVLGLPPKADAVDNSGYVPLLNETDMHETTLTPFGIGKRLGIDPAGEGDDETVWVLRDHFKSYIVAREKISTSKTIAQKTLTIMEEHQVNDYDVYVDNFGEGANVAKELALAGKNVNGVNVGDSAEDSERYLNMRAEAYWRVREWLRTGGALVTDEAWKELLAIRYRSELNGKLRIMGKADMRKLSIKSPNYADALMLTFVRREHEISQTIQSPTYTAFELFE